MKVIRIIDCSAGNESVGEMWQETKIFDGEQPIKDLFKDFSTSRQAKFYAGKRYIHLSIPNDEDSIIDVKF